MDENLSPRGCGRLNAAGHEVTYLRDEDMCSATDPQVFTKAAVDGRVLLTADRGDFGRELVHTQAIEPSVILLRQLPDVVRADDVPDARMVVGALTE